MSSQMDQTSMSTIDLDNMFDISGDVNGDPPPPPSHPFVQQPFTVMAPQRQNVRPMQPSPLYRQTAFYRQVQNQPIVQHVLNAAATDDPAAPPQPYNNVPAQQIQNLPLFGHLPDGRALYLLPAPTTVKTEPTSVQTDDGSYIKKPPNAFILFMKEQRPIYAAKMKISGSAVVNAILGQKWKSLSKYEQDKYCEQADVEKRRHAQCHPDWKHADNYGVKRKRVRTKASRLAAKLTQTSTSGEVTQQTKKPRVASVVEAPPTNTFVPKPPNLQTTPLLSPDTEVLATVIDDIESIFTVYGNVKSFFTVNGDVKSFFTVNGDVKSFFVGNDDVESFWLDLNELVEVKKTQS